MSKPDEDLLAEHVASLKQLAETHDGMRRLRENDPSCALSLASSVRARDRALKLASLIGVLLPPERR